MKNLINLTVVLAISGVCNMVAFYFCDLYEARYHEADDSIKAALLEPLVYFFATVFTTIVVTGHYCRVRIAQKKRINYGTLAGSSSLATLLVFVAGAIYRDGWAVLNRETWAGGKGGWETDLIALGVITALCLLPAMGVAFYYQRPKPMNTPIIR